MNASILSPWEEFTLTPSAPPLEWDGHQYRVASGMAWQYEDVAYAIPRGFTTDGASIPRLWRWRFSPWGQWIRAAVVHDWLYRTTKHNITRKQADKIFCELMRRDGVGWWKRNVMYRAVRIGGWIAWKANNTQDKGQCK